MTNYLNNLFSVKDKKVLITGGGTGLGRFIAEGYAAGGATVYIVGRRKEKLDLVVNENQQLEGEIIPIVGDVSSKEAVEKIRQDYEKHDSSLDVLINCAGVVHHDPVQAAPNDPTKLQESLWSSEWGDWQHTWDINVSGLFFLTVAFIPLLSRPSKPADLAESPSVINISSITGCLVSRVISPSYATSKAAVIHLTKVLAARLIPYNIRVNAILPGMFPSEMTVNPDGSSSITEDITKMIPEQRGGVKDDIVGAAVWLGSRAGGYVSGETVKVDGGRSLAASATLGGQL